MDKRKIILVTDGDELARHAVEVATKQIGGRCISISAGNPTQLTGSEIAEEVSKAPYDPVVVMFDDNGNQNKGYGENALGLFSAFPSIEIIGAIAVASGAHPEHGLKVDFSIDRNGNKIESGVDKHGNNTGLPEVFGDTLGILNELDIPIIVGMGDPGKMDGRDDPSKGAPITTKALREIVNYNNSN